MQASRAISEKAIRLASGRIIQGRILGEDGHPVSGTQVSFVRWDKTRIPAGRTVATSDADGNFSWPSAPAGSVELEFSCKGFFDRTSTIEADEGGPLATRMYRRTQQ
jgi:hypothetical protein